MDQQIRDLERRAAKGEPGAHDALRKARIRAGVGEPVWIADLIDHGFERPVPLLPCVDGVRAVIEAAGLAGVTASANKGSSVKAGEFAVYLSGRTEDARARAREVFFLGEDGPINLAGKIVLLVGDRDVPGAPRLAPEHQEAFLAGVRAHLGGFDKARVAPAQGFARGTVVRLGASGSKRARHVVARVEADGRLTIVPLAGVPTKTRQTVEPDLVTLDADQDATFAGSHAAKHRAAFERLG